MKKIVVFSGTTEGRELSDLLSARAVPHIVCVAGEYGREMMSPNPFASLHVGRMDATGMADYLRSEGFGAGDEVIDATHPYAAEATGNIIRAADALGCIYRRIIRSAGDMSAAGAALYADMDSCAKALEHTEGNILLTTGSKELSAYCDEVSEETRQRTYVRVLPAQESIALCRDAGIRPEHIIAMHGPFSLALNCALIGQYDIRHLVTKESGEKGGFQEKAQAAARTGACLHVIARPVSEEGQDVQSVLRAVLGEEAAADSETMQITLAGIGMGDEACRTLAVTEAIRSADIVFGSSRLLRGIRAKQQYDMYRAAQIIPVLEREKPQRAVIIFSGDTGFYSGAGAMLKALRNWREDVQVHVLPGISSFSYLAARTQERYEDAKLCSLHGKNTEAEAAAVAREIRYHARTFVLLSGPGDIRTLAEQLIRIGTDVQILAGIDLSYASERIDCLNLREALNYDAEGIASILVLNPAPERRPLFPVRKDTDFIRERIPMTKECVRHESIIRLGLREGDVVYDIGGGTGSVAIEAAALHPGLRVYTIERKHEAVELIRENIRKHHADNVTVIEGDALKELIHLPKPDCVFVGGSGGELTRIVESLAQRKSGIRYVINAVSLETMEEVRKILQHYSPSEQSAVLLSASDIQRAGEYHMMHAHNPVAIFSFTI